MSHAGRNESADRREETKAVRRIAKIINQHIRECLLFHKKTDVDTVYDMVTDSCSHTLSRVLPTLGRKYLRIMIQHSLKHVHVDPDRPIIMDDGTGMDPGADTVPLRKGQEIAEESRLQPDLPGMEMFRNVPNQVSIRLPSGHVIYVPYLETLEADRAAALELLGKGIEADQRKYHALQASNEFSSALVRLYGDLPLHELVDRWRRNGCPKVA